MGGRQDKRQNEGRGSCTPETSRKPLEGPRYNDEEEQRHPGTRPKPGEKVEEQGQGQKRARTPSTRRHDEKECEGKPYRHSKIGKGTWTRRNEESPD